MRLLNYRQLTGKIVLETGLHIGGSQEATQIGGLDNPVIRRPIDNMPFIPGSSLKGKMRSLLELSLGNMKSDGKTHEYKEGVCNVILDLSATRYCDSSGLSSVLVGNRLCKTSNGALILTGLQPSVKKLITISQLEPVLNIVPTVSEAVDYLFMASIEKDITDNE